MIITKQDIISRIYFITRLVQNQKNPTMTGALTSKSDFMGGIFDRFINTLSDSLVFNEIIFKEPVFQKLNKSIKVVEDFYYYNPSNTVAGIAPDIFGITVDNIVYPFTQFDNKWKPVTGMPQIEIKTFKAKDQMISLRNQNYDGKYLILVDLNMRIDYLVPFLDKNCLNPSILDSMQIDDSIFIIRDEQHLISKISPIDFSSNELGTLNLISITTAVDFMKQATLCDAHISVRRIKNIVERKQKVKSGLLHEKLLYYANQSTHIPALYTFNSKWISKMNIPPDTESLDFSAQGIEYIEICKYNNSSIVITAVKEGCSLNDFELKPQKQYTVTFDTLDRSSSNGKEYFIQKQCACYLKNLKPQLIKEILNIINK